VRVVRIEALTIQPAEMRIFNGLDSAVSPPASAH
jgi:hypothetical protein